MKNFQLSTSLRALLKELTCDCDSDDSAPCRMKAVSRPLTDLIFALQAALMKERVRNDRSISVELVWTSQQEGFRIGSRPSPQCHFTLTESGGQTPVPGIKASRIKAAKQSLCFS
ncbi:hypothetical protein FQA47_003313 [Oryzias melastigma]|uniref:Uncharacterized protein n=1 Tax=Oryzias melastigma TaxID=30732 RepID=A0A834F104_ORYME|nr:hypothetical protein FQA47_003313 [Oryzias melastigma]